MDESERDPRNRFDSARAHIIPIALAARPLPNFPRLRALALFSRRSSQPVVRLLRPAAENLHRCRLMHRNKVTYSITSSARARKVYGISRPSALAALRLRSGQPPDACNCPIVLRDGLT